MIYGHGVDILAIKKVARMSRKMGWALAHQILGHKELEVYSELADEHKAAVSYLARRFAAKEAFIKASKIEGLDMRHIQILNHENGEPYIALYGKPSVQMGGLEWVHHVTISDNDEHVIASVICERKE